MADATHRVIRREDGSFAVKVTRPGTLTQLTVGRATETEANAWVGQDNRLWQAADPPFPRPPLQNADTLAPSRSIPFTAIARSEIGGWTGCRRASILRT
jgi:hypothetical protein